MKALRAPLPFTVKVAPDTVLAQIGDSFPVTVSITGPGAPSALSYHWKLTGSNGSITSATHSGPEFDGTETTVTYKVSDSAVLNTADQITVTVYEVATHTSNDTPLGSAVCTIGIRDATFGTVAVTINGASFDTSILTRGSGKRVLPNLFARIVQSDATHLVINSDSALLQDAFNTYIDFGGPVKVGAIVDLSKKTLGKSAPCDLELEAAGSNISMFPLSGTLTVTGAGGGYVKLLARIHMWDTGKRTMDVTVNGWLTNIQ